LRLLFIIPKKMNYRDIQKELKKLTNPEKAKFLLRYFKTGKGEYGEGDEFLGITVPEARKIAKKFKNLPFLEVKKLLESKIHEHRFVALEILVFKYRTASEKGKKKIVSFYLKNRKYVNNWDLVDTSAPYILGNWLLDKNPDILYKLAKSKSVWDRRIAVVSTLEFIRNKKFKDTLKIAEILLADEHDLIHKASGWMLREVGNKSRPILEGFLKKHLKKMPRTMLRYSIEKFPKEERELYLAK